MSTYLIGYIISSLQQTVIILNYYEHVPHRYIISSLQQTAIFSFVTMSRTSQATLSLRCSEQSFCICYYEPYLIQATLSLRCSERRYTTLSLRCGERIESFQQKVKTQFKMIFIAKINSYDQNFHKIDIIFHSHYHNNVVKNYSFSLLCITIKISYVLSKSN